MCFRSQEFFLSDCDHVFCKDCVDRFQKEPDFCPVCKKKVRMRSVRELSEDQKCLFEVCLSSQNVTRSSLRAQEARGSTGAHIESSEPQSPARLAEPILVSYKLACRQSELLVRHLNAKIKTIEQVAPYKLSQLCQPGNVSPFCHRKFRTTTPELKSFGSVVGMVLKKYPKRLHCF